MKTAGGTYLSCAALYFSSSGRPAGTSLLELLYLGTIIFCEPGVLLPDRRNFNGASFPARVHRRVQGFGPRQTQP
jgi:hypothetical protein